MNILERWKSRWSDKRFADLRESYNKQLAEKDKEMAQQQEQSDKELQYVAMQCNRRVEVLTRERDAANRRCEAFMTGMRSLLKTQGSIDDRSISG